MAERPLALADASAIRSVPWRTGRVEREGGSLYFEATGSGPSIVFAHGLGGSHLSWWQQVPHFATRYTCVTFAHRGFLPSRDAPGGPGPKGFAADLLAILDHLDIARAVLVGQSMGGWTCLEVALQAPERVRALVMSATSGTIDYRQTVDVGLWAAAAAKSLAEFARDGVHPAMGARAAREQPSLHLLYRAVDDSAGIADKEAMRRALGAGRTRSPDVLDGLRMPVLFLDGDEDVVFPPAAAVALATRMGTKAVLVERCGHSPYFERAEIFNRILDDFLAGLSA
jgi:3-oxoadipate enol-lactonase